MQIHTTNAEAQILNVVSSMDLRPESWNGWVALHIEAGEYLSDEEFIEATLPIKAIIGSYLREIEGAAFFRANKYIYMLCKGAHINTLKQAAIQISELVFEEIYLSSTYRVYDLAREAELFAENVIAEIGEITQKIPLSETLPISENTHMSEKDISHVKVLLVEDDAVIRWMVRNSLKHECDFAVAPTAKNVFSLYPSFRPDIVFLDIGLPDDNGTKVLEWIINHDPKACVVMLSGQDNIDNITDCIGMGAKGFIPKPFIRENLLQYIRVYSGARS